MTYPNNRKHKLAIIEDEVLKDLYVDRLMSMQEVSDYLGVSKSWISKCLHNLKVVRDKYHSARISRNIRKQTINSDLISKLYYEDNLTMKEIGNIFGVSSSTIDRRSRFVDRITEHRNHIKSILDNNGNNIIHMYVEDKISPKEIADKLGGISKDSIIRYLIKNNLRRNIKESKRCIKEETRLKMSKSKIGTIPWNKGVPMRENAKIKMRNSIALLNRIPWNKGKIGHLSIETRNVMSMNRKGKKPWNYGLVNYLDDKTIQKMSESQKNRWAKDKSKMIYNLRNKPHKITTTENAMKIILDYYYPNEYKYTGNGEVRICGYKPDFINCNGQKKIIEVFGNYWHSKTIKHLTPSDEAQHRIDSYKKYGYETLIIWGNELNKNSQLINNTIDKIIKFNGKEPHCKDLISIKLLPNVRERFNPNK